MNHSGLLEYHFGKILDAVREVESLFPDPDAISTGKFYLKRNKLLRLFYQMGHNAQKTDWYEPEYGENPHDRFASFHPSVLTSAGFSLGYFKR